MTNIDTSAEARPLDEVYDTMMEVQRNPTGAFDAIQSLSADLEAMRAERDAAKRIEQLTTTDWRKAAMTQNALLHDALTRAEDAEAKLAKAVDALRFYAKEEWPQNYPCGVLYAAGNDTPEFKTHLDYGDKARAVMAELEKTE